MDETVDETAHETGTAHETAHETGTRLLCLNPLLFTKPCSLHLTKTLENRPRVVADTLVFTGSRQSRTRLLCLDPTGNFLLIGNQGTNQMLLCRIDQSTGQLKPSGPLIDVPSPVCIIFVPPPDSKPQRE